MRFQLSSVSLVGLLAVATACSRTPARVPLIEQVQNPQAQTLLVVGEHAVTDLRAQAVQFGIAFQGDAVLRLTGSPEQLARLTVAPSADSNFAALADEPVEVPPASSDLSSEEPKLDEKIFYMGLKDMGVDEFLKKHPTYDGRGVVVGVVDDGISPGQAGLSVTSDGKRKLLKLARASTLFNFKVIPVQADQASSFAQAAARAWAKESKDPLWQGVIDESKIEVLPPATADLNSNGAIEDRFALAVIGGSGGTGVRVCIDLNQDAALQSAVECIGTFALTGEYTHWRPALPAPLSVEFDEAKLEVKLAPGEPADDSHGEGVASVIAGHQLGGPRGVRFDGVAPGAQLVDWDLSSPVGQVEEAYFTLATYLGGIEWCAQQGAKVANLSYTLFFESARTQSFTRAAIDAIVRKYGIVLSFSAGNLGPGLGSAARRGIYPSNVLVAGAYVSRETDEYVHGVTGLPPEGRVIFYSSRGPSADGGAGPMVITPLANLAHGEPAAGYRPFSGTSSASPALGGLATLLISAAQQEGLPIDVRAIVHALRLSARPIANTPFIDQGYGLPNISRAWRVYRELIAGETFAHVNSSVLELQAPDGAGLASGVLVHLSRHEGRSTLEYRVRFQGIAADTVEAPKASSLLATVRVEYSAPWLQGASRLWISSGNAATLTLGIDLGAARRLAPGPAHEILGDIRLIEDRSGLVLHTIPVTLVDDVVLSSPAQTLQLPIQLGAEEGVRRHFQVPQGAAGVRVRGSLTQGAASAFSVFLYDSARALWKSGSFVNQGDILFATPRSGWHQLGFARRGGTNLPLSAQVEVEPVWLKLMTGGIPLKDAVLSIENGGKLQQGRLILKRAPRLLQEVVVTPDGTGRFEVEIPTVSVGRYSLAIRNQDTPEVAASRFSCASKLTPLDSQQAPRSSMNTTVFVSEARKGTLRYSCRSFEHSGAKWSSLRAVMTVRLEEVARPEDPERPIVFERVVNLAPGRTRVALGALSGVVAGGVLDAEFRGVLDAEFRSFFGDEGIHLGELSVH